MGKPYKKGICERCGFEGYVNDHHIIPRMVKRKDLSVNEAIEQGFLLEVKHTNDTELSSENIVNDLESGFKQIRFENGANGKALAVLSEEGFYPVYAETDEKGISKLIIDLRVEQE